MNDNPENRNVNESQNKYQSDGFFDDEPGNGAGSAPDGGGDNGGARYVAPKKSFGKRLASVIVFLLFTFVVFTAGFFSYHFAENDTMRSLDEIIRIIDATAVDYTDKGVKNPDLAINYFVKSLLSYDEYAQYYGKAEFERIAEENEGHYSGFGMTFYNDGKNIYPVYNVVGNSPAYRAGMKSDDVITGAKKSDETEFTEFENGSEMLEYLGEIKKNEEVTLRVSRGESELLFTLKRESYTASYVLYKDAEGSVSFTYDGDNLMTEENAEDKMSLSPDVCYISLSAFEGEAAAQIKRALEIMNERGKSKMIFDLRHNGGGDMSVLTEIASYLVKADGRFVVTYINGKNESSDVKTISRYYEHVKGITVLADSGTASASECLIGAMISLGSVAGENGFSYSDVLVEYNKERGDYSTYGKGIMQSTYMLSTGGALKLTTAKIVWPDGETCIHGKGIAQTDEKNQINSENAITRALEILAAK